MVTIEDLVERVLGLETGAHLVYFYRGREEQCSLLCPIVMGALRRSYGCIFVFWSGSRNNLKSAVRRRMGPHFDRLRDLGQIISLTEDSYRTLDGKFSFSIGTENVRQAVKQLLKRRWQKVVVTGEMIWAQKELIPAQDLFDFQAMLNVELFPVPVIAICQYDMRRFSKEDLLKALYTHPLVLYDYIVYRNASYIPPMIFLQRERKDPE